VIVKFLPVRRLKCSFHLCVSFFRKKTWQYTRSGGKVKGKGRFKRSDVCEDSR
jgi:hypothetical protein